MAHGAKNPTPMMSTCAGFQSNLGGRHLGKEGFKLRPPKLATKDVVLLFHAVQRKNILRCIDRYTLEFHWDGPSMVDSCDLILARPMPWAVPPQQFSVEISKQIFVRLKMLLRKAAERTVEATWQRSSRQSS
jgi:hypothetical protein